MHGERTLKYVVVLAKKKGKETSECSDKSQRRLLGKRKKKKQSGKKCTILYKDDYSCLRRDQRCSWLLVKRFTSVRSNHLVGTKRSVGEEKHSLLTQTSFRH